MVLGTLRALQNTVGELYAESLSLQGICVHRGTDAAHWLFPEHRPWAPHCLYLGQTHLGQGAVFSPFPQIGPQTSCSRRQELGCELMWLSTAARTMAGEAGGVGMAGPCLGPGYMDVLLFILGTEFNSESRMCV